MALQRYISKTGLENYWVTSLAHPEGDKVLIEIREDNTKSAPAVNSGKGKFIYGTGKFTGIEGTMEYKRWYVRPATKDTLSGNSQIQNQLENTLNWTTMHTLRLIAKAGSFDPAFAISAGFGICYVPGT